MHPLPLLVTIVLLAALLPQAQGQDSSRLNIVISDHQTAPYVLRENGQISGGILKELVDQLAQRLNLSPHYTPLPRKRLDHALASGATHLLPDSSHIWHSPEIALSWSRPWMEFEDRFLQLRNSAPLLQSYDDLKGKRVGTVRGHHYPELEVWFEQHQVYRDDAQTSEQNLKKLAAGRIDALIGSSIMIAYQIKQHPDPEQFILPPMLGAKNRYSLGLTPSAPCTIEQLNNALQQLIDEGVVEQILGRYH